MATVLSPSILVKEQLYDSLGRTVCTSVTVAHEGLFGFIDNFITPRDPQQATDSWVDGGPLNTDSLLCTLAWAGNTLITDTDRQYAYSGNVYEADPLARTDKTYSPGEDFNATSDQAVSFYNSELPSGISLPSNLGFANSALTQQFGVTAQQSSLGSLLGIKTQTKIQDLLGRKVAQMATDAQNNSLMLGKVYQLGADLNNQNAPIMATVQTCLPNYYDANYTNAAQLINTQYNALKQAVYQNFPDSGAAYNFYDAYGRLRFSQIEDNAVQPNTNPNANNVVIYYLYDALNRMTEVGFMIQAWDLTTFQTLTAAVDASQFPASATLTTYPLRKMTYDQLGDQFILENMGQVTQVESWNTMFDASNNVKINSQSYLLQTYVYDSLGRVTQTTLSQPNVTTNSYTTQYSYDCLNNVIGIVYPQLSAATNFSVNYGYYIQGQVASIGTPANPFAYATYQYNAQGQIVQENLGSSGGQYVSYTYGNTLGQMTGMGDYCGLMVLDITYTDANSGTYQDGNIQTLTTKFYVQETGANYGDYYYTYDSFGRLTAAQAPQAQSSVWNLSGATFDANGNLQAVTEAGQAQTYTYAANGSNQLSAALNSTFAYSASGLTTTITTDDNKIIFNYDQLSSLPTQITTSTDIVNLIYDAKNERYQKSVGNTTITYLRGLNTRSLSELTTDSASQTTTTVNYIYGPKGLIIINNPSVATNYIVLKDQLGSTRIVHADVNPVHIASIVAYFNYSPYGELVSDASQITSSCPIPLRYLYTGQEWDSELGLYNYHARQYHPALGRFLTPDPAHQFANPYCYVGNNPVNNIDPTGEMLRSCIGGSRNVPIVINLPPPQAPNYPPTVPLNFADISNNDVTAFGNGLFGKSLGVPGAIGAVDVNFVPAADIAQAIRYDANTLRVSLRLGEMPGLEGTGLRALSIVPDPNSNIIYLPDLPNTITYTYLNVEGVNHFISGPFNGCTAAIRQDFQGNIVLMHSQMTPRGDNTAGAIEGQLTAIDHIAAPNFEPSLPQGQQRDLLIQQNGGNPALEGNGYYPRGNSGFVYGSRENDGTFTLNQNMQNIFDYIGGAD